MRGEKSRRGRRSTTKKGRTAVWDIGHRRSLLHRWGRLSPATLCWLRRPQPQTRSRKVSYDLVREERGQVMTDQSVDVVFCMSVLHHLQLDRVKKEIRRILKPDGLFILKEPVRFSWTMEHLRKLFPPREDVSEFEHPLNSKQLNTLAEGFQVLARRSFRTP